jgi:methylenetetrahydrofolate reductase (NADPH)
MTDISIELVPRTEASLRQELELIKERFPAIKRINIPDILRFDMRSWDGCAIAEELFSNTIPHLRAIDFDPDAPLPILEAITKASVEAVLVISGDPPVDMGKRIYRTTCLELIRRLKRELPDLKVYAGLDPYRSGIKEEIDYLKAKRDAGAEAFFTQPFFDLRLMEIYQGFLGDYNIYWGLSPVLTLGSRNYWENRNHAIFPPSFEPTLEWNRDFAVQTMEFAKANGGNVYFMPIRTDIAAYLDGII